MVRWFVLAKEGFRQWQDNVIVLVISPSLAFMVGHKYNALMERAFKLHMQEMMKKLTELTNGKMSMSSSHFVLFF